MSYKIGQRICLKGGGEPYTIVRIECPNPPDYLDEDAEYDSDAEQVPDYYLHLKSSEEGKPEIKVSSSDDGYTWYPQ